MRRAHGQRLDQPATLALTLLACAVGCRETGVAPQTARAAGPARLGRAELLACLGAPPEALYQPERLAAPPAPGLAVHTFDQATAPCGPVQRRYVSYVPPALGARATAPVLIVLHGQGASAEAMMTFQTRGTFNRLADAKRFVVAYGNGLPTSFDIAGLPNSGRWRSEYTELGATVDELGYLRRIVDDLTARAVIAGGNDVYLVGQSNGGGMALSAARQRPDLYAGVAAFMPFVGFSPTAPPDLAGARLRRVLFAYSDADPALPPSYASQVLAPLARGWARALKVSEREIDAPAETARDDVVKEGQGLSDDEEVVSATRDSTVKQLDARSETGALRQLVFDHAGHFWPTREYADPAPLRAEYGLRNQDVEGADETWRFLRDGP
ncbi:MAG TPA: alpha/beta hydrolase-fold protein [Polyangia bacterium]|jgi:poly(3-hydroxybutyrate) depolymerase